MKPTIIIDYGHGGIDSKGNYLTPASKGKRFFHEGYDLHDGGWFYEGIANRVAGYDLAARFLNKGYPVVFVADQQSDTFLVTRANRANKVYDETGGKCIYISLHFNAGGGKGYEIFTAPGQTESDILATRIFKKTKEFIPERKYRSNYGDGDPDKERKFTVLTATKGVAVLIEFEFFDNPGEVNDCVCLEQIQNWNVATHTACIDYFKHRKWI